jgi:hypothetical protein
MTGPALARNDADGRRFYTFGSPPEAFWSVTTIISGGVPKHLQAHYAKLAAELAYAAIVERGPNSRSSAIVRRLASLGRADVVERQARGELKSIKLAKLSTRDLALRWIKGAADRHRDAAAARGTAVHQEAEQLVLAHAREASRLILDRQAIASWPAELEPYQAAFVGWVDDFAPVFVAAEATVFNRTQAYAGTLDAIVHLTVRQLLEAIAQGGGGTQAASVEEARIWAFLAGLDPDAPVAVIVDFKTGTAVYPEVALQLAPYARAEFIGAPDGLTELPMPEVALGAVLHLTPKGYRFRLVRIDQPIFDAFCFAREVYRFNSDTAKSVLLQDLTIRRDEAAA